MYDSIELVVKPGVQLNDKRGGVNTLMAEPDRNLKWTFVRQQRSLTFLTIKELLQVLSKDSCTVHSCHKSVHGKLLNVPALEGLHLEVQSSKARLPRPSGR